MAFMGAVSPYTRGGLLAMLVLGNTGLSTLHHVSILRR
jgi:hypothetical protein